MVPSALTWPSAMASSSADWVRGPVRLISSAIRTLVNTGPRWNSKLPSCMLKTDVPVMSLGRRSGVHWIRVNMPSMDCASVLASSVLPTPGVSWRRMCPSASSPRSMNLTVASDATTTLEMLSPSLVTRSRNQSRSSAAAPPASRAAADALTSPLYRTPRPATRLDVQFHAK